MTIQPLNFICDICTTVTPTNQFFDFRAKPSRYERACYHYNARLNKCFYLSIGMIGNGPYRMLNLFDLHESKAIAVYIQWSDTSKYCSVRDKQCASEEEWRALIKPFMED
jgi:hypothetical protein